MTSTRCPTAKSALFFPYVVPELPLCADESSDLQCAKRAMSQGLL